MMGESHAVAREEIGATTQIDPDQMRSLIAQATRPANEVAAPSRHLRLFEAFLVFAFALALGVTGTLWWLAHHQP